MALFFAIETASQTISNHVLRDFLRLRCAVATAPRVAKGLFVEQRDHVRCHGRLWADEPRCESSLGELDFRTGVFFLKLLDIRPAHPLATTGEAGSLGEWRSRCRRSTILFGKYELLERINVGGMAEIVRARDTAAPGAPIVAVKRILPHLVEDHQFVAMFLDESRVLSRLRHPDIIGTREVGTVEGVPYIALDYVDGKDARMMFHQCRRQRVQVPIPLACFIMAEVCAGLHAAHEHRGQDGRPLGLVHRDVSLQNLLLSYDGAVKVTDFGIALSASNRARTEVGVVKGKFGYMSPEQVKSERLDRRSDVFAAGICLWELLTCERLFSGNSDYEAIERVRKVAIEPASTVNSAIEPSLDGIVLKALARRPKQRYATAAEMSQALRDLLRDNGWRVGPADLGAFLRALFGVDQVTEDTPVVSTPVAAGAWEDDHRSQAGGVSRDRDTTVRAPAPDAFQDTGLSAFEHLEPVSAVSGLDDRSGSGAPSSPCSSDLSPGPGNGAEQHPSTPYGAAVPVQGMAVALPMDWGEEEPPTHSRGPEGAAPFSELPSELPSEQPKEATAPPHDQPLFVEQTFTGSAAPPAQAFGRTGLPITPTPPQGSPASQAQIPTLPPPPHSRHLPFARVVGAILAIVAVTTVGLLFAKSNSPGRVRLETSPPDALVTVDGEPVGDVGSPYDIADLDPDVVHVIAVTRQGYRPWQTRIRVQRGRALTLPLVALERLPTPVAATGTGKPQGGGVGVPSEPSDGTTVARSQASGSRRERAQHERNRRVRSKGQRPARGAREPGAFRTAKRASRQSGHGRRAASGTLRINSRPWSKVIVDGRPVGNTPQMSLKVSAGRHEIELVNPKFGMRKRLSVRVGAGEVVTRIVDLE